VYKCAGASNQATDRLNLLRYIFHAIDLKEKNFNVADHQSLLRIRDYAR
jgi:hypothetical protein